MKKKTVILVVAKSGVGKDSVIQGLIKKRPNLSQVKSYATRKPRYENEDTHIFITRNMVDKFRDEMIAYTEFHGNIYFATVTQLEENDFYVIDPKGVDFLKELLQQNEEYNNKFNIKTVYIEASVFRRFTRMLKRGDGIVKTIKRLANDRKEFKNFVGDINITNDDFDYTVNMLGLIYNSYKERD